MAHGKKTTPGASAFPHNATGDALRLLEARGADMSAARDIDFEHVFANLDAAEQFERTVRKEAIRTKVSEYNGDRDWYWNVQVVVQLVPTYASVTAIEEHLGDVARQCGGEPDGWGTPVL